MDLSGLIFAALAVGWAVYLIPKALQHNDELAKTRAVSTFSGRMRVLGSGRPPAPPVETPSVDSTSVELVETPPPPASRITREAARKAARRRRRVLLVLVFALGTVSALSAFAIAPVWAPAIPGGLVVAWLVIARMSVRRQTRRMVSAPLNPAVAPPADADEETAGIDVSEIRAASRPDERVETGPQVVEPVETQPVADEGSLWDPLPMTLPTYVTKPTARRTVRTIALTQTTSSGHDAADTKLARDAEAARKAQADKDAPAASADGTSQRKVAGA